jgi:hypothetical protein
MLCQGISTLRVRPPQLRIRTVRCLSPDARSVDKTFSRTDDRTLTAVVASFKYLVPASATQMIRFRELDSRCPNLTLCFRTMPLRETSRRN